jgi:hypothetical protein
LLFTSSFLEDAFRIFEILKNIFILAGAIFLFVAARNEYKGIRLNRDEYNSIKTYSEKEGGIVNE